MLSPLSSFLMLSWKDLLLIIKRSSMYYLTYSRPLNNLFIFSWNISGLLHGHMGRFWYPYLPQGSTIVHSFLETGHNLTWYYPMIKSCDVVYLKCSNFNDKSYIFGIGKGFLLILLLSSLKSEMKQTVPFFWGITNLEASNLELFSRFTTAIFINLLTSVLRVSSCILGIGKGLAW